MPKTQSIHNKKGEVDFRKRLAEQFSGKKVVYPGEPSGSEYIEIIKGRIKDYTRYFNKLKNKNILQEAPFLELGAGVGQGAMLLENTYNLEGFTSDISLETLALAPLYKKVLGFKKMPMRVVCDVYNLPFITGSIPFVFTFQTLHHLPDPRPVLKEIKRVLAPGGYFYFNEEPVAQVFNLNLWRRDLHLRWFEKILKGFIILHFISRIGKSEVDHNILEETFTIKTWENALNLFPKVHARLAIFPFKGTISRQKNRKKSWLKPPFFQNIPLQLLGGGIEALCQNSPIPSPARERVRVRVKNLLDCLACPNCPSKPNISFQKGKNSFICRRCKSIFTIKNDILILLSNEQKNVLYPK